MTRALAESMAKKFLDRANPGNWDGRGDMPAFVSTETSRFRLAGGYRLALRIDYCDGEWCHLCALHDMSQEGEIINIEHGYSVDSVPNVTDTILSVCKEIGG